MNLEIIEYLESLLQDENGKLVYMFTIILLANVVDFLIGFINAKFNPQKEFNSSKAIYGILRKVVTFILMIIFVPIALLVGRTVGLTALWILLSGYLYSEITSILSQLNLAKDGKEDVFSDFIKSIFKGKK